MRKVIYRGTSDQFKVQGKVAVKDGEPITVDEETYDLITSIPTEHWDEVDPPKTGLEPNVPADDYCETCDDDPELCDCDEDWDAEAGTPPSWFS